MIYSISSSWSPGIWLSSTVLVEGMQVLKEQSCRWNDPKNESSSSYSKVIFVFIGDKLHVGKIHDNEALVRLGTILTPFYLLISRRSSLIFSGSGSWLFFQAAPAPDFFSLASQAPGIFFDQLRLQGAKNIRLLVKFGKKNSP